MRRAARARTNRWLIAACVLSALPPLQGAEEHARRERFVAMHGDDRNDGASWQTAWQTVGHGVNQLGPGTTLTIGPGVYRESVRRTGLCGTARAPIVIRARFPGTAVLSGFIRVGGFRRMPGKTYTWVADLPTDTIPDSAVVVRPDTGRRLREVPGPDIVELVLQSFAIDRAAGKLYVRCADGRPPGERGVLLAVRERGLWFPDSVENGERTGPAHLTIDGLEVRGFAQEGIRLRSPRDVTIQDCVVHDCAYGILIKREALRTRVLRCDVFGNQSHYFESANIQFNCKTVNCAVRDCRVHDSDSYGLRTYYEGWGRFEESDSPTVFERNIIWNCQNCAIGFKGGMSKQATARGNVVLGWGLYIPVKAYNTFSGDARSKTDVGNLYFGNSGRADVLTGPGFVDPENLDYRLQSDSPARGKGPDGTDLGAYPYRGDVFFVKPDGDDSRPGTSLAGAWRTLAHAGRQARPGHTVLVAAGTYNEPLRPAVSGTKEQPIVFRARGRDRVVIEGRGTLLDGVDLTARSYVRVEGFTVQGCGEAGIRLGGPGSAGLAAVRCTAYANGGYGVLAGPDTAGLLVQRCTIVANARAGVRLAGPSRSARIEQSIMADNAAAQIRLDSADHRELYVDHNAYDLPAQQPAALGVYAGKSTTTLDHWRALAGADHQSISADPRLLNPREGDFRLAADSPCRNAGLGFYDIGAGRGDAANATFRIDRIEVRGVTASTATITWWTPEREGNTQIEYGTDPEPGQRREHLYEYSAFHHAALTGLEPDTTYYYRVGTGRGRVFHTNPGLARAEELAPTDQVVSEVRSFRTARVDPPPRTYYVSATVGRETNDGLAPDHAFKRIEQAAARAAAGDTVIIEPGTYREWLIPLSSGTADRPITFKSAGWAPVILEGKLVAESLIRLVGVRHIRFQGFHLHGIKGHKYRGYGAGASGMVWIDKASDIRFRYCFFDGRGSYAQHGIRCAKEDAAHARLVVEDCAFLAMSQTFVMRRQAAEFNHCVFGISYFGNIRSLTPDARIRIRNCIATGAIQEKMHEYGYLVRLLADASHVESDYNGYWRQPYDTHKWIAILNDDSTAMEFNTKVATLYKDDDGLPNWRRDTGNDAHSVLGRPDFITYKGTDGWPAGKRFDTCEDPETANKVTWLDDFRLGPNSDFKGKGENGADLGIRFPEEP
ncbi:MAG: right-handed parallel beta-helix repeat-containing protein [Kiritimatiellae bacterium]|nr:right-handed parallel beta-helix repeat-containing protein [Kiritimatiellia bacterium]